MTRGEKSGDGSWDTLGSLPSHGSLRSAGSDAIYNHKTNDLAILEHGAEQSRTHTLPLPSARSLAPSTPIMTASSGCKGNEPHRRRNATPSVGIGIGDGKGRIDLPNVLSASEVTNPSLSRSCPCSRPSFLPRLAI